jgi:uncharacterized membrane protein
LRVATSLRALVLLFGCLAALVPAAGAQGVGDNVSGHVAIDGKQVPLPRGEWLVAGVGAQDFDMPEIGAFGAVRSMVLFQREGSRVVAVAEINTNAVAVNDGWGRTRACARAEQFLLVTRYRSGWETSCLFVQPTRLTDAGPTAWQAARRLAATSGLTLPPVALTAGFRLSDRQDIVDLRFHFDPALLGGGGGDDWSAATVRGDPARLDAVQRLSAWAMGYDGRIAPGLRNRLAGPPAEAPQNAAYISETPQVDGKLRALDQLLAERAITRAEYLRQSRIAVREMPVVIEQSGGLPLSVQKNLSFRLFGSSVDYFLAFVVTLDNPLSAAITASIVAIHSVLFVLNDNYWEDHWARRTTRDANRLVDFTYIGEPA